MIRQKLRFMVIDAQKFLFYTPFGVYFFSIVKNIPQTGYIFFLLLKIYPKRGIFFFLFIKIYLKRGITYLIYIRMKIKNKKFKIL
jgi:hypothetical protein